MLCGLIQRAIIQAIGEKSNEKEQRGLAVFLASKVVWKCILELLSVVLAVDKFDVLI